MKFFATVLLTAVIAGIAELALPWWGIAVAAFAAGLVIHPPKAFLAGFTGIFLLWLGVGLWRDVPNYHILSTRMAGIFHLPGYALYLVVTAVLGGLLGGLAAWAGSLFVKRRAVKTAAAGY